MSKRAVESEIRQTLHPMLRDVGYKSSSGLRRLRKHHDFFLVCDISVNQLWDDVDSSVSIGFAIAITYFVALRSIQRLPWIDSFTEDLAPTHRPLLPSQAHFDSTSIAPNSPANARCEIGFYLDDLRPKVLGLRDRISERSKDLCEYEDWAELFAQAFLTPPDEKQRLVDKVVHDRGLMPIVYPTYASAAVAWLAEQKRYPEALLLAESKSRWQGSPVSEKLKAHWASVAEKLRAISK